MNRARGIATAFICASLGLAGALTGTLGQAQAQGEGKGKGKQQEQSRFELLPGMTMLADGKSLDELRVTGSFDARPCRLRRGFRC